MSVIFPRKLIEARKSKNLTQEEAAKGIGISRGALANYEAGLREPNIDTINKIASFYKVNVDSLVGSHRGMYAQTYEDQRLVLQAVDLISESMRPEDEPEFNIADIIDEDNMFGYFLECDTPKGKLFQALKGASDEEIEQATKIIEALRK